jgi:hypothetical protein
LSGFSDMSEPPPGWTETTESGVYEGGGTFANVPSNGTCRLAGGTLREENAENILEACGLPADWTYPA